MLGALGKSLGVRDGCSSLSREGTELLPQEDVSAQPGPQFGRPFSVIPRCCRAQRSPAGEQRGGGGSVTSKRDTRTGPPGLQQQSVTPTREPESSTQHQGNVELE